MVSVAAFTNRLPVTGAISGSCSGGSGGFGVQSVVNGLCGLKQWQEFVNGLTLERFYHILARLWRINKRSDLFWK